MKEKITLFLLLLVLPMMAQWKNETFQHDRTIRDYRIYVPSAYQDSKPASLVFALHGLSQSMVEFSRIIAIEKLAEKENIIVVCPQGLTRSALGFTASGWNSGASFATLDINAFRDIDDVGFIRSLIDKFSKQYAINSEHVFAFGFSLGGFMTQRLALELSDRIQSFASVAGTIGNGILPIALNTPPRAVSIAHFHGTEDNIVGYNNNDFGLNVDGMINFWRTHNLGGLKPEHFVFPKIAKDNMTVERFTYTSNFNTTQIVLFKVNNGLHNIWLREGTNDISYTDEIWNFFKTNSTLATPSFDTLKTELVVYPNPLRGNRINIRLNGEEQYENQGCTVALYDATGRKVIHQKCDLIAGNGTVTVGDLPNSGMYWMEVTGSEKQFTVHKKLLVSR